VTEVSKERTHRRDPAVGHSIGTVLDRILGDGAVEQSHRYRRRFYLAAAVVLVAVVRIGLYFWARESAEFLTDFDQLYKAGVILMDGGNPYRSITAQLRYPLFYPLPAVLVALPFTLLRLELARPAFDIVVGWVFAYALWRNAPYRLLALVSGAYLFAMRAGQTTPIVVAGSLVPALGALLTIKANTGLACFIARPNRRALVGGLGLLTLAVVLLPSWPLDWWAAIHMQRHIRAPLLRPFGWLLLLAAFRWRTSGGRLLLALALIPQNTLPHELLPLALIPSNAVEMAIYVVGSWVAVAFTSVGMQHAPSLIALITDVWPMLLVFVYLPALYMVLRRPKESAAWEPASSQVPGRSSSR
jgi:hypothetical protein